MNVAEWIIVGILLSTLFIFLILGIFLLIKLLKLSENAKLILETGQDIADKTEDVVDNVKDMTSVGKTVSKTVGKSVEKSLNKLVEKGVDKLNSPKKK